MEILHTLGDFSCKVTDMVVCLHVYFMGPLVQTDVGSLFLGLFWAV